MQKGEHGNDGSRHRPGGMWIACGLPKPVPRSTKTTIMTVHVNPIMQAAPSQRRIISIIEASNQLLFHSLLAASEGSCRRTSPLTSYSLQSFLSDRRHPPRLEGRHCISYPQKKVLKPPLQTIAPSPFLA